MKAYSWNMLFRNEELDDAFAFVRDADFDIFCLQEVPTVFLARLKELPYQLVSAVDTHRHIPNEDIYVVILSKHPIERTNEIPFPNYVRPLQQRLFTALMRPFHFTKASGRHGLWTDIRMPHDLTVRVFCLHLVLGSPAQRASEFDRAMQERTVGHPTIVCGDFNILESPKVTLLNWLLGGRLRDILSWNSERADMERRFIAHDLKNPLLARVTHPFSRSQLDHILVPETSAVNDARVFSDCCGSDHLPITVDITL